MSRGDGCLLLMLPRAKRAGGSGGKQARRSCWPQGRRWRLEEPSSRPCISTGAHLLDHLAQEGGNTAQEPPIQETQVTSQGA